MVEGLGKVHTVTLGKVRTVVSVGFSRPVGSGVDGDYRGDAPDADAAALALSP